MAREGRPGGHGISHGRRAPTGLPNRAATLGLEAACACSNREQTRARSARLLTQSAAIGSSRLMRAQELPFTRAARCSSRLPMRNRARQSVIMRTRHHPAKGRRRRPLRSGGGGGGGSSLRRQHRGWRRHTTRVSLFRSRRQPCVYLRVMWPPAIECGSRANHERACNGYRPDGPYARGGSKGAARNPAPPGGQCRRNPLCVRGFRHRGLGGPCRLRTAEDGEFIEVPEPPGSSVRPVNEAARARGRGQLV